MTRMIWFLIALAPTWGYPLQNPFEYLYPLAYPASGVYTELNYEPRILPYNPYMPGYINEYVQDYGNNRDSNIQPRPEQPTLNIMAELPYSISKQFSVVPLFIVPKDNMNMISNGQITSISQNQPLMTIKLNENQSIQCTPAVRMVLEKPIIVGRTESEVLFPSEVQILHEGVRIPIKIGAVIAPVLPQTAVAQNSPISVRVVYAVPTRPIKITITIEQESAKPDDTNNSDAVVVENEADLPPKNITITDFPSEVAQPSIQVDEEDEELVNRNPPSLPLAPAGIVQSTQPQIHNKPFHNDKDSPYLDTLKLKKHQ
ncbi:hypothetical protein HUJ04_002842 [Dendroctonus ponderosae]|nr:hypothetical protein HUJ04_002842 [Dendroctonus ponderosae]KAH1024174.1 hypothetical protein HUJ05_003708 [Dendroctonus ponderosae]